MGLPAPEAGLALLDEGAHALPRVLAVDAPAGEDQLLRERRAYEAREPLGAAHARENAEADLGEAEQGVLGRDPYVARDRDLAPTPQGEPVDGGYRGHGAPVEQGHRRVPDLREPLRLQRAHRAHRRDVSPRDKRPVPGPRHDYGPRSLRLELQEGLPDLLDHRRVEGIQFLLAVDGKDRNAAP